MTRIEHLRRGRLVFDVDDVGPESGTPVVLLHGFPANRTGWRAVTPALTEAGLRCLAPDQRGYSVGARPPGRRNYRRDWLVDDVLALIDRLDGPVHLVGHDWGGLVAWRLAQRAPDALRSLTVLSTPHPAAFGDAFVRSDQLVRSWYMGLFQVPWIPERVLAGRNLATALVGMGLPTHIADQYAAHLRDPAALRAALDWYRALPLPDPSSVGDVPTAVTVPTTFVWGSGDEALGRSGAERTERYVAAPYRFVEVPENHWLPETAPALVADTILDAVERSRMR
ncbi:alpha/beta fold hydrolase [Curtobacterium sp. RRHDQ10]|uniref:alpha/beta fold hydrolase n=1 Tax=Curtobacterium phyllosphaerae TaxID=3413379 RepID=UPI003BF19D4B